MDRLPLAEPVSRNDCSRSVEAHYRTFTTGDKRYFRRMAPYTNMLRPTRRHRAGTNIVKVDIAATDIPALNYVRQRAAPIVIKADGLAMGTVVAIMLVDAKYAVNDMLADNALAM
ncbi:MAG: hypothetical protein GPOALKHO_001123 [Sodalis sp.]|nr:MAG: hypothetical protein GPOALKHO_001123 [Sodalis sp.]